MASVPSVTVPTEHVTRCYLCDKPAQVRVGRVPFCARCFDCYAPQEPAPVVPDPQPYLPRPTPPMHPAGYCRHHGYSLELCDRWCGV